MGRLIRLATLRSARKVCNYKYKFGRLYWLREMYLIAACQGTHSIFGFSIGRQREGWNPGRVVRGFRLPDLLDQFVPILFGHPEVAYQYIRFSLLNFLDSFRSRGGCDHVSVALG